MLWLPAVLSFLIYVPTLFHGGVTDDRPLILENPYLVHPAGVIDLWTHKLWEASAAYGAYMYPYYRPIPMTSFWVQIVLFGAKTWWLRLGNLFIHALTATLLPRFLLRASPRLSIPLATVIGLVWALHPLNSESVIWLSGRFDSLVLLFSMATLYANTTTRASKMVPVGLILALLTKEVAVVLLPTIVLFDVAKYGGWRESYHAEKKKWFASVAMFGLYLCIRYVAGVHDSGNALAAITPGYLLSGLAETTITYARLAVVPIGLDVHHWSEPQPLWLGLTIFSFYVIVFVGSYFFATRTKTPAVIAATCLAFFSLATTSTIGPAQFVFGDRFSMFAGVGVAIILGELLWRPALSQRVLIGLFALLSTILAILTLLRGADWESEEIMTERALARNPNHPHWLLLRAQYFLQQNRTIEARNDLERALRVAPDVGKAHVVLCVTELRAGNLERAAKECVVATQLEPLNCSAWNNLASVHANAGQYPKAVKAAQNAIRCRPSYAEAEYLLAVSYANLGTFDLAELHLERGLALAPAHPGLQTLAQQLAARKSR